MRTRTLGIVVFALSCCLVAVIPGQAAPPWLSLFSSSTTPTSSTNSKPAAPLELTEKEGPWLILTTSFAGPTAEQQATDLVNELRDKFGFSAYVHRLHFDYTERVGGLGVDMYGAPRKFKHLNGKEYDEIAVMVGNFSGIEDPNAQKAVNNLKTCQPKCLEVTKAGMATSQRYATLRTWQRYVQNKISASPEAKTRGPLGNAFLTRNPLLPEEMFTAKGLDPFVVEMNQDQEHTLLNNKGRYTVKVASFKGVDTLSPAKFQELTNKDRKVPKIDEAADKAKRLTAHLRGKGYEAYVFHDTTESIVCVGSFNDVGAPRQDGKMEINQAVLKVMQQFGPVQQPVPGQSAKQLQPRIIEDQGGPIILDYQPMPVEVPRKSLAAQYSPTAMRR